MLQLARQLRLTLAAAWLVTGISQVARSQHPLDPISPDEYKKVVEILRHAGYTDAKSRYPLITLEEPRKDQVLKPPLGETKRKAFVIAKKSGDTFESIVDLTGARVVSWQQIEGVQPGILPTEEWNTAQLLVRRSSEWRQAIQKRGIENLAEVICIPLTVGYYGLAEEEGRRLVKLSCYHSAGVKNFWGRPVEGLTAVFDLNRRQVVKVIDTGVRPLPGSLVDLDTASIAPLRKPPGQISVEQPEGRGFTIDGHIVEWQKWRFHFRIDPRLGPIISTVTYNDQGKRRSILYQGSLSELFVPYMDPDIGWYFRTYLDAGEYGVGKLVSPLRLGSDCPSNAVFLAANFADDWGDPYERENAACLFERYAGDIAWRHYESVNGAHESRKAVDLVVRFVAAVGNYDYIFDWVFRQDGVIRVAVGATGVEQVKAVKPRDREAAESGEDTAHGRFVAPHTLAVNHDHFFSFRLDLDVDGRSNSFVSERLETKRISQGDSPRKSVWVLDSAVAETEQDAKLRIRLERPALWRVINPSSKGPLGYPASYQLKPRSNAVPLLSLDDFPQRRAGFTNHHLWVTPFRPRERYAAGTYPNQSKGGDGLPRWTSANRKIEDTDIVLWYTVGFHHVVRAEDWPVLPTSWTEFELRPFDYFQRNPALDLPE